MRLSKENRIFSVLGGQQRLPKDRNNYKRKNYILSYGKHFIIKCYCFFKKNKQASHKIREKKKENWYLRYIRNSSNSVMKFSLLFVQRGLSGGDRSVEGEEILVVSLQRIVGYWLRRRVMCSRLLEEGRKQKLDRCQDSVNDLKMCCAQCQ